MQNKYWIIMEEKWLEKRYSEYTDYKNMLLKNLSQECFDK